MDWKNRLLKLREQWYLTNYEGARDFGVPKANSYNDKTANGLIRCIYEWLKFNNHYVNRINTQGQVRVEKVQLAHGGVRENIKWTTGTTNKGTADIDSIINSRPVKIEVKVGKDHLSTDQIKEMNRVLKAGGIYYVAHDMESFVKWYDDHTRILHER